MVSVAITVLSAVFSGLIAIGSTVAIEKLGGRLGGVLATSPSTVIPFSFALALAGTSYDGIRSSMFAVPVGICLTSLYLTLWRESPRVPIVSRLHSAYAQVALVLPLLLGLWFAGAVAIVYALPALSDTGVPIHVAGVCGLLGSFCVGLAAMLLRYVPAPTGKRPVTALQYASRGIIAGTAIAASLLIADVSAVAGGVASVFPSVTTTTMVTLWVQQGSQVPAGAAGPMMLGNVSVSTFCVLFALLYPAMDSPQVPLALTLSAVCLLCYVLSVVFVSAPIYRLLQWGQQRHSERRSAAEDVNDALSTEKSPHAAEHWGAHNADSATVENGVGESRKEAENFLHKEELKFEELTVYRPLAAG